MYRKAGNFLIIGLILLIAYFHAGHGFTEFYFEGKTEILEVASRVNKICNDSGSCPTTLEGWRARGSKASPLFNGNMRYLVIAGDDKVNGGNGKEFSGFRLIYSLFMSDHWFEVEGGVGKPISAGWKSR